MMNLAKIALAGLVLAIFLVDSPESQAFRTVTRTHIFRGPLGGIHSHTVTRGHVGGFHNHVVVQRGTLVQHPSNFQFQTNAGVGYGGSSNLRVSNFAYERGFGFPMYQNNNAQFRFQTQLPYQPVSSQFLVNQNVGTPFMTGGAGVYHSNFNAGVQAYNNSGAVGGTFQIPDGVQQVPEYQPELIQAPAPVPVCPGPVGVPVGGPIAPPCHGGSNFMFRSTGRCR